MAKVVFKMKISWLITSFIKEVNNKEYKEKEDKRKGDCSQVFWIPNSLLKCASVESLGISLDVYHRIVS